MIQSFKEWLNEQDLNESSVKSFTIPYKSKDKNTVYVETNLKFIDPTYAKSNVLQTYHTLVDDDGLQKWKDQAWKKCEGNFTGEIDREQFANIHKKKNFYMEYHKEGSKIIGDFWWEE